MSNTFWGTGESLDFGKVAIEYAAGKDVVLDTAFIQYECYVNMAHQLMLYEVGVLKKEQVNPVLKVLQEIQVFDKKGMFHLKKELEDVHSNVEEHVLNKLGVHKGGNLGLGLSRNELVYTDTRMFLREKIFILSSLVVELVEGLSSIALSHTETVMPSFEHSRISQPITYAHWLLSKCYHFLDDTALLLADFSIINQCPQGMAEQAGTVVPIDRKKVAEYLGFEGVLVNSLYAANTRGELEIQLFGDLSMLALHMKKTMNELILWSSEQYGLIEIDELYVTGATASPTSMNPDTLEVVRANCSKMYANFLQLLVIMDSLPSGYNRDTQQTKPILFEGLETVETSIKVFTGIITSLKVNKQKMQEMAESNFSTANDMVNKMSLKGNLSFREAYMKLKQGIKEGNSSDGMSSYERVLACKSEGGPSPKEVKKMIKDVKNRVKKLKEEGHHKEQKLKKAFSLLEKKVTSLITSKL